MPGLRFQHAPPIPTRKEGASAVESCGAAGLIPVDDDPAAAATTIWVGLHGLAHQRLVAAGFPWPPDVEDRLIAALTGLRPT